MRTGNELTDGNDSGPGDAFQSYLDGDSDGAISIARTVLKRHQGDGNRIGEARSWIFIALLHYHVGGIEESSASMESALIAFTECGERSEIARCHRWLGRISERNGEIGAAEGHFRASWSVYVSIGDHASVAAVSLDIGDMRYLRNDCDDAAKWWVRSWNIAESQQIDTLLDDLSIRYDIWFKRSRGDGRG